MRVSMLIRTHCAIGVCMDKWPKMIFLCFPKYCVYWISSVWIIYALDFGGSTKKTG